MAAVFKWRIEKYSRCYPSEQPAQPSQALATSVQPIWVHLSNRNLELCLTGIAIPRHDPISQVSTPLLRIYTDGQMVLESLYLNTEDVQCLRVKAMVKGSTMGFRYTPGNQYQVKFLSSEDCLSAADILGHYFSCKSVISGDSQFTQAPCGERLSRTTASSSIVEQIRPRMGPGADLSPLGSVSGNSVINITPSSGPVQGLSIYGSRSEMLPPRSIAISPGVSVPPRAIPSLPLDMGMPPITRTNPLSASQTQQYVQPLGPMPTLSHPREAQPQPIAETSLVPQISVDTQQKDNAMLVDQDANISLHASTTSSSSSNPPQPSLRAPGTEMPPLTSISDHLLEEWIINAMKDPEFPAFVSKVEKMWAVRVMGGEVS